jgi:hypothetical protein
MAARAPSLATAREYAAALLAAEGKLLLPAEAQRLAQLVAELERFVHTNAAGVHDLLRTPGLMRAAITAVRRAPDDEHAWGAIGSFTVTLCRRGGIDRSQRVAEALAAGAAALLVEFPVRFVYLAHVTAMSLGTLLMMDPHQYAHTWRGLPEVALEALRLHPGETMIVSDAVQLLEFAVCADPACATLVLTHARVVTAALASSGEGTTAEAGCVCLLGAVASARDSESPAVITPAAVSAAVRMLCNLEEHHERHVAGAAHLLSCMRGDDLADLPGVATALVVALTSAPASMAVRCAVCRAFTPFYQMDWSDKFVSFFNEARAAEALLPMTMALRACVAARGDKSADPEQASAVLCAASSVVYNTPRGHDDSDIDEAVRAGAAVAAMALARRHESEMLCRGYACNFIKGLATSPARCETLVAAGALKFFASAMRDFPERPGVIMPALVATTDLAFKWQSDHFAAAAGEAGLVEQAAHALSVHGVANISVAGRASNILAGACSRRESANQARAIAAGAPAASVAALRAHVACDFTADQIMFGLCSVLHGVSDATAALAAAAAGAVPAIVAAMQAHPDAEDVQLGSGNLLYAMFDQLKADARSEALRDSLHALVPALEAGLRRHHGSVKVMGGLTRGAMCVYGGPEMTRILSVLAEFTQKEIDERVLSSVYFALGEAAAWFRGVCLTAAQLATALRHAQRFCVGNPELAMMALAIIAFHVQADASLAASPLYADSMVTAVASATAARQNLRVFRLLRSNAAVLLIVALEHGGSAADAAVAAGRRAGLLPLLEDGGTPLAKLRFWTGDLEAMRPTMLARLRPAPAVSSAACSCNDAACECCAKMRASGKRCGLPGCGASRRTDDSERMMAKCGRCRRFAYCCKAHQTDDWPRHKSECRALAAAETDDDDASDDAEE